MRTQKIFTKNDVYQKFEVLKTNRNKRHKYSEFFVEGVRNITNAIENNWTINSFLYSSEKPLSKWAKDILSNVKTNSNFDISYPLLQELSSKEDTSELMAVVGMKSNNLSLSCSENPIFVLFDRPSNKGNLGTLLRSCDAFGVEGLIITGHAVDIYEPNVVSSSMGSFFKIPFTRLSGNIEIDTLLAELKKRYPKLIMIGTTSHDQTNINELDLTCPVLFMIGNETDGLNRHLMQCCDVWATIPMHHLSSASSFNVSCAATVMLYEAVRQRMSITRT